MLGMALFLTRYTRTGDNASTVKEAEQRWIDRNKKRLPHDDRTPRTILTNYCAEMQFTEEQVDNELDWTYLTHDAPLDDTAE